jgi:hypothetical protein
MMVRLTDSELLEVRQAAQTVPYELRPAFLERLALELRGRDLGDGLVHRVAYQVARAITWSAETAMGETVMTRVWGEQPVIDTWTDCRNIKGGWCGKSQRDGVVHIVTYDPRANLVSLPIARMPAEDYFVVHERGRANTPIGAIRIEKRVPRRAKRAMPATLSHARSARKARRRSSPQNQAA